MQLDYDEVWSGIAKAGRADVSAQVETTHDRTLASRFAGSDRVGQINAVAVPASQCV